MRLSAWTIAAKTGETASTDNHLVADVTLLEGAQGQCFAIMGYP
jgi:hypothetical protein